MARVQKNCPDTQLQEALSLQRAGRLEEAAKIYRAVLADDPQQPTALHLLGVVALDFGNLEDAIELISGSLRIDPNNVSAINNLAGVLKAQGRFEDAIEFYQAALALAPERDPIHNNLGNVLRESGRYEEAIGSYRQALALNPDSYEANLNLGVLLNDRGLPADAIHCFERALAINGQSVEARVNMGISWRAQRQWAQAEDCFTEALKLDLKCDAAHNNLGSLLNARGWGHEAIACYWRALEYNPKSHLALNNLGNALRDQGRLSEALACFEQSLKLQPDSALALNNRGNVLKDLGQLAEASESFEQSLQRKPDSYLAYNNLGTVHNELGRAAEAAKCFRRAVELKADYHEAFSNLLLTLNYLPEVDREARFAEHRRFDAMYCEPLRGLIEPHANAPEPERRLRVGFVSGDLREHPVAFFIEPVFAKYNPERSELFCYANHLVDDAASTRLKNLVQHWEHVAWLDDNELAAMIRRDRIDILVDLSGHTARNRLLVFARKPAPIQVGMIGYMQTTGMRAMDYRITEERLDPTGLTERFNAEELIRLPHGAAPFCPPQDCPSVNALPALSNGYITFGSFNSLAKVTPDVVEAWARVLKAVPSSRFIAVGRTGNSLRLALESHGVAGERLEILDRLPMQEYLQLHYRVDFLLDTFPYSGGTTNLLALWMGLPFVTLAGASTAGSVGAGMLRGIGLAELVAEDVDLYVGAALHAVIDMARLAEWRQSLRSRLEPLIGDGSHYTRQLERAFRAMWQRWCSENDPLKLPADVVT